MEKKQKHVLAIDIGASSGRAMLAAWDGQSLSLTEVHRFENTPVAMAGTLYWDVLRLWHEIKQSIAKACKVATLDSIGVDTWGVDFGLLDANGQLLANPVHYRDTRTKGMMAEIYEKVDAPALYGTTGTQLMDINTVFQLAALQKRQPGMLQVAQSLLLMPDLFAFFLSGAQQAEASIASTSQLYDPRTRQWAGGLLHSLSLPGSLFPQVIEPGSRAGMLRAEVCEELGVPPCAVVSVCGHDTQSAMVAVPAQQEDFIFLSSGTWSLLGTELPAPLLGETARGMNLSNESAWGGKTALLANITGLWLIQESRRQWRREGEEYSFGELEAMARAAKPFQSFIRPDDPMFATPGNLPRRIAEFCVKTGQLVPKTPGEVVRCIAESLAFTYRETIEKIVECTAKSYTKIHIIGGGVQDALLCGMTANACGRTVVTGPIEATALGNAMVQLAALGAVDGPVQARKIIANTQHIVSYEPEQTEEWDVAYQKFCGVVKC